MKINGDDFQGRYMKQSQNANKKQIAEGENDASKGMKHFAYSVCVFLSIITISMLGLMYVRDSMCQKARGEAIRVGQGYVEGIQKGANQLTEEAAQIVNLAKSNPKTTWFNSTAKNIMEKYKGIVGIELNRFDLKTGKLQATQDYPANFAMNKEPGLLDVYKHFNENLENGDGHPHVIGPAELKDGNKVFVTFIPIYVYDKREAKFQEWGIASITMKLPEAIEGTNLAELFDKGYEYLLLGNNPMLPNEGTIISSVGYISEQPESVGIPVAGGLWVLKIAPTGGFNGWLTAKIAVSISVILGMLGTLIFISRK